MFLSEDGALIVCITDDEQHGQKPLRRSGFLTDNRNRGEFGFEIQGIVWVLWIPIWYSSFTKEVKEITQPSIIDEHTKIKNMQHVVIDSSS